MNCINKYDETISVVVDWAATPTIVDAIENCIFDIAHGTTLSVPEIRTAWRNAFTQLSQRFSKVYIARTRAVFIGQRIVVKIPINDEGFEANVNEAFCYKNNRLPIARCWTIKISNFPVLVMEKVDINSVTTEERPEWSNYIDSGQVGRNSRGEIVAYDI